MAICRRIRFLTQPFSRQHARKIPMKNAAWNAVREYHFARSNEMMNDSR